MAETNQDNVENGRAANDNKHQNLMKYILFVRDISYSVHERDKEQRKSKVKKKEHQYKELADR